MGAAILAGRTKPAIAPRRCGPDFICGGQRAGPGERWRAGTSSGPVTAQSRYATQRSPNRSDLPYAAGWRSAGAESAPGFVPPELREVRVLAALFGETNLSDDPERYIRRQVKEENAQLIKENTSEVDGVKLLRR